MRTEKEKASRKKYQAASREKINEAHREWYLRASPTPLGRERRKRKTAASLRWQRKNPEAVAKLAREWHEKNKERRHELGSTQHLKRKYGLTPEAFLRMKDSQEGKCVICGDILKPGRRTQVDHCHKSGRIRAILCGSCNSGLGHFRDNIQSLQEAIEYLKRHLQP